MKRIFISYRRSISKVSAPLLYVHLRKYYDKNQVFMDVDHIQPGDEFPEKIRAALATCEVFLAIIDKNWATVEDHNGLRLEQEEDWVRREILTVLERNRVPAGETPPVKIVPIVINDAGMPDAPELPEPLRAFCRLNFVHLQTEWKKFQAGIRELQSLIEDHLGSPPTGEFGFEVLTKKANPAAADRFRYRAVAKPDDLKPYIDLSDDDADIAGANPEASGESRWGLYDRWCQLTAKLPAPLDWYHPDNEVRSFLTLERKLPDGSWMPIGVSIILPLTPAGGVKLMCTGAPENDDHAKKINALSLGWDDLVRGPSPCLLLDTWIIAKHRQTPSKKWARYVHDYWGTCLILRHLGELWSDLGPDTPRTFLAEPDNPAIHRMLWKLGFERRNRNAASGDIYYFQYPPNPYLYDEHNFIARYNKVIDNIDRCRDEYQILREPAAGSSR
ncbi:MAG: toll/interleukin-1 receptor domain-containing protein [Isosphaeraceae bacterium]|nr:toll/interleukin-1 receptor domain-containing protein [Isosphaeraceae bacterium]